MFVLKEDYNNKDRIYIWTVWIVWLLSVTDMLRKDTICVLRILLVRNGICEQLSQERTIKDEEFQKIR